MKILPPTIALLCLASFSCDKAKELVDKAKSAVSGKIAQKSSESGDAKPDPELQKLVDLTPEGVVFRKDLPFPGKLEVKITRKEEVSGRISQKSELGGRAGVLKGTLTTVTKLERTGDNVSYALIDSSFAEPIVEGAGDPKPPAVKAEEAPKKPKMKVRDDSKKPAIMSDDDSKKPDIKELTKPSEPCAFVKSGSSWKPAVSNDFHAAYLAQTISPVFDQLLVENTLAPRALWFGKKRLKIGDQLMLDDKSLPMLVTGNAKGSLKLTLQSFEAVKGHPCGVFAVTGDFSRNQFPDFDGTLTNEDLTIQSGKFWLSLLYPLILKEETEAVQTIKNGGQGGLATRIQVLSKVSVIREWKKSGQ